MSMSDYQHTIKEKHSVSNTLILWAHQGKTGDGRACLPSQVIITIINDEERDGARSVQHRVSSVNGTMMPEQEVLMWEQGPCPGLAGVLLTGHQLREESLDCVPLSNIPQQ